MEVVEVFSRSALSDHHIQIVETLEGPFDIYRNANGTFTLLHMRDKNADVDRITLEADDHNDPFSLKAELSTTKRLGLFRNEQGEYHYRPEPETNARVTAPALQRLALQG